MCMGQTFRTIGDGHVGQSSWPLSIFWGTKFSAIAMSNIIIDRTYNILETRSYLFQDPEKDRWHRHLSPHGLMWMTEISRPIAACLRGSPTSRFQHQLQGKIHRHHGSHPKFRGVLMVSGVPMVVWGCQNHLKKPCSNNVREERWFVGWVDPTVPLIQWKPWAWHSCRLIQVSSEDVPPKKTSKFSTSSLLKFWAPGTSISTSRYIKSDLSEV